MFYLQIKEVTYIYINNGKKMRPLISSLSLFQLEKMTIKFGRIRPLLTEI